MKIRSVRRAARAASQGYSQGVIALRPTTLEGHGVRLEPLSASHTAALAAAVQDGRLWEVWYTRVPKPEEAEAYVAEALAGQ